MNNCIGDQKGVGLIEVLVAVFILAGGLLGLAALQTHSLRYNHESYMRTVAAVLASDMADRLRVNSDEAIETDNYKFTLGETPSASATACETAACTPTQLAPYDYKQWSDQLAAQLPGGKGSITPSAKHADGWREYTITIQFNTAGVELAIGGSAAGTSSFTSRTRI